MRIEGLVHGKDLPLEVLVLAPEHFTLTHLLLNRHNEVALHLVLGRQVGQVIVRAILIIIFHKGASATAPSFFLRLVFGQTWYMGTLAQY